VVVLRDEVSVIDRSNYITHWTVLLSTFIAMPKRRQDNRCKRTRQEQSTERGIQAFPALLLFQLLRFPGAQVVKAAAERAKNCVPASPER